MNIPPTNQPTNPLPTIVGNGPRFPSGLTSRGRTSASCTAFGGPFGTTLVRTIKSGRGTWPEDTATTCLGKVRMPRDGGDNGNYPIPEALWALPSRPRGALEGIHSSDPGEVPPVPCRIVSVRDDGTILITLLGKQLELWNHDPVRLRALIDERGAEGSYQERWRLLRIPSEAGNYCVDPERRLCPSRPPRHETLFDQLAEAGGFTIGGSDFIAGLERLRRKKDDSAN
jgi:hypothetical protein